MQSIHQDAENKCLGKTEQEKLCAVRKGKEKKVDIGILRAYVILLLTTMIIYLVL